MKGCNRFLSVLLCFLLLLPLLFQGIGVLAVGEADTYVLNYESPTDEYDGPNLEYFSPYRIKATLDGETITMRVGVFSLYNSVHGHVIPAYCSDITVLAKAGYAYRRINLEDSTFAASASGKIRAILNQGMYLMGMPGETEGVHKLRVEQRLKKLGDAAGVEDLTIGEAINATQCAIWQVAHGPGLVFTDFALNIYLAEMEGSVRYYDLCDAERKNGHAEYVDTGDENANLSAASKAYIGSRIEKVFNYLLSLEPIPQRTEVVSGASFRQVSASYPASQAQGPADITVTAQVKVDMEPGDSLSLTASLGQDYRATASLSDGIQTVTLTLQDVPAELLGETITLTIDGYQSGMDAYLFDANGDRQASQSMVGEDDSRLYVYATTSVTPNQSDEDRIIHFYKTTLVDNGTDSYERLPLEGIVFDLYFVAELKDYLLGNVILPEAEAYPLPESPNFTLITDEEGKATINLTQHGMPDGVYLVVEQDHPAIAQPVAPFYVTMPSTNPEGTGHIYEVTVQPKNDVKGGIRIEKDVISLGNDSSSQDAYADHTWIIGTTIPEDLASSKSFQISDTLDPRLDYMGNVRVTVETVDGETVAMTLTEGLDYSLTMTDVDSLSQGTPSDSFTVALTSMGRSKVGTTVGEQFNDYMLRVYFDARINSNAQLATEIPNQAKVNYTNSVNFDFEEESDEPVVYTGGARLLKVSAADGTTPLSGAQFELYRYATADEVAAGGDAVTHIPGVSGAVVQVSFFDNEALDGNKVTTVTSDANGEVKICGLTYGEYFLLETKAPAGYNLLEDAVKLTVDGTTHLEEKTVVVENVNGTPLPSTGGMGTTIFTVSGLTLMAAAVLLLLSKKRKFYN